MNIRTYQKYFSQNKKQNIMKKLIIILIAASATLFSCQKKTTVTSPTSEATNADLFSNDAKIYCNGKQVFSKDEITNFTAPERVVVVSEYGDHKPALYFFDTPAMAEEFVQSQSTMHELAVKAAQCRKLHEYAMQIGELDRTLKTNTISDEFQQYADQIVKKTRPTGVIYDFINYTGANHVVNGLRPNLATIGWTDRAESACGIVGGLPINLTMWDQPLYGGASIWIHFNHVNFWAIGFANITSSIN
jgi:hypothetical protein